MCNYVTCSCFWWKKFCIRSLPSPGGALGLLCSMSFALPQLFLQRGHASHQLLQLPVVPVRLPRCGVQSGVLMARLQAEHQSLRARELHLQILHLLLQRRNITSCSVLRAQTRPPLGCAISARKRCAQLEIVKFCTLMGEERVSGHFIYFRYFSSCIGGFQYRDF